MTDDDALHGYPRRLGLWGWLFFGAVALLCAAVLCVLRMFNL